MYFSILDVPFIFHFPLLLYPPHLFNFMYSFFFLLPILLLQKGTSKPSQQIIQNPKRNNWKHPKKCGAISLQPAIPTTARRFHQSHTFIFPPHFFPHFRHPHPPPYTQTHFFSPKLPKHKCIIHHNPNPARLLFAPHQKTYPSHPILPRPTLPWPPTPSLRWNECPWRNSASPSSP